MPSSTSLAQAFLGLAVPLRGVLAGHAMFEPKIGLARSAVFGSSAGLPSSVTENATMAGDPFAHDHHGGDVDRRWVTVDASNPNSVGGFALWPDKTIRYCYKDVTSKGKLYDLVVEAMKVWYTAGLDESFQMVEVSDTECANNRPNVLLIDYDPPRSAGGSSKLSTTPAKPNGQNPSMTLSDDATVGMLSVVSNVAHEIGHAWGLYHEHQNPYFWATAYGGNAGTTFSAINWVCDNLADYADVQAKIDQAIADYPNGLGEVVYGSSKQEICTKRNIARQWGFSGADYLPLTSTDSFKTGTQVTDDVDWESIMIYPTGAGGKTDGSGNRAAVLSQPNGSPIPVNLSPSTRDIQGLMGLYGMGTYDETLLNDPRNQNQQQFLQVRNLDVGVSCST